MENKQAPKRLPPRVLATESPEQAAAKQQAREQRDAEVRGVSSIHAMREAIKRVSRELPAIREVPRISVSGMPDAAAFRARAAGGLPFLITGMVKRWPLSGHTPALLRERFGHVPVRARTGRWP